MKMRRLGMLRIKLKLIDGEFLCGWVFIKYGLWILNCLN